MSGSDRPTENDGARWASRTSSSPDAGPPNGPTGDGHNYPASRGSLSGLRPRQVILAGAVLLVVVVVGVYFLGGGGDDGAPAVGGQPDDDQASPGDNEDGSIAAGDRDGLGDTPLADAIGATGGVARPWDNVTLELQSTVEDPSGTLTTNQTIRIDAVANRTFATTRMTFGGGDDLTIVRESYSAGGPVYVMQRFAGSANRSFSTREVVSQESAVDLDVIEDQFNWTQTRTTDGDYLYSVNSVAQYTGDRFSNAMLDTVQGEIRVDDETGVVLEAVLLIEVLRDGERYRMESRRVVTVMDSTTVDEPDWLDRAKNRIDT